MGETTRGTTEDRADIYQRITDSIAAAIEKGAGEWRMPWHSKGNGAAPVLPINVATGRPYRGVNTVVLWVSAEANAYSNAVLGTYRQWKERGAQVLKGEHASPVVFWKPIERDEDDGNADSQGEAHAGRRFFAKGYSVFNAAQVDGYEAPALPELPVTQRIEHAESFFSALGATIGHGGNRAFYRPADDRIQMPPFEAFRDPVAYYATLAHEVTHWSGHPARCARDLKGRFGDEAYAAEELIAELGAAFLCADLDLASEPRPDHAAYVQSWLKVLRSDKRAIFTAAAKAQAAADYVHEQAGHLHSARAAAHPKAA
jgi:antirestriction protein ArdC